MFHDLNIDVGSCRDGSMQKRLVNVAIKVGFDAIALNQTVFLGDISAEDAKAIKVGKWELEACTVRGLDGVVPLRRLTLVVKDAKDLRPILNNNPLLKNWDVIAVQPSNEQLFLQCIQSTGIDIITFNAKKRLFKIKNSVALQAFEKGIFFEVIFNDFIQDSLSRQFALSTARRIVDITKGKNMIITSGGRNELELRGPYDLINFGMLFGMDAAICRKTLTANPQSVLLHARTRRTFRGVLHISQISELTEKQQWMLPDATESQNTDATHRIKRKREDSNWTLEPLCDSNLSTPDARVDDESPTSIPHSN